MSSATLSLAGCGDDKPRSRSNREFGKGIDQIVYTLGRAELSINIGDASGISEHLQRTVDYIPNKSKDKIERVIDGSNFKLKINGIDALVPVSSQENIDHERAPSEDSPACKLSGLSKVVGEATSLDLRFNWNLKLRLEGSNCDLFIPKYQAFLTAELGRFNLSVVKSLLDSSDLAIDDQRQIELNLTMSGESN
jgi:hypothetical protein